MIEEEIDLKELIMLFWKKRVFIIIISIIAIIIGVIYTFFIKSEEFTSQAFIVFGRIENYEPKEGESQLLSEIQFNSSIISTYKNFMTSNEVLQQVIDNLSLNMTLGELKEKIEITTDSAILFVDVTDSDFNQTIKIVNEIVNVFVEKARDFYQIKHAYTISEADESTTESNTNNIINIMISFILGFGISVTIVFVKYLFDPKINNQSTIENKLNLPLISSLKLIKNKNGEIIEDSEQFKVLRANIEFSTKQSIKNKSYFITSANRNDGKTFVAVNLAIAFSKVGKKVLVVDTDKKDGNLHKVFGIENEYGLSNYLVDANKISEKDKKTENYLIQETKFKNLCAVSIGDIRDKKFEIIQNDKFIKFINDMKEKFDIIILDGAEMVQYADSRFLSNICDQTLLVASANKTKESELLLAQKEIEKVKGNFLGVILNYID